MDYEIFNNKQLAAKRDFSHLKVNGGNRKQIMSLINDIMNFNIFDCQNFF